MLILWGEMAITGESPLYAQLFLTPGVLKNDPVFDHPLGDYLSASWIKQTAESRSYRAELPVVEKDKIDPTIFTGEPLEFSYDLPRGVQSLKVAGVFDDNQKSAWLQKLIVNPSTSAKIRVMACILIVLIIELCRHQAHRTITQWY